METERFVVPDECRLETASYRGYDCVKLTVAGSPRGPVDGIALLRDTIFENGVIELVVASELAEGAAAAARGFVGCAFRCVDIQTFDKLYLRPTNARADDQLRRNHSVQYTCEPEWPWQRLRSEFPCQYESYTDLELGAWTPMRIEVEGPRTRLYVNGNDQPALVVNELKGGNRGGVGLWIGPGTIGYFRGLEIRR